MGLKRHKRDWDDLGRVDPLWAVLSSDEHRGGKWDEQNFFATGHQEIEHAMAVAATHGVPISHASALDFGCGVGRLTRALSDHFEQCTGVDISETMVDRARTTHADRQQCRFIVNTANDLRCFPETSFDLVYSKYVLQHLPSRALIRTFVTEFVRVLRPGGILVFQLPAHIPAKNRIQLRRRLYVVLRELGISERVLHSTLRLTPMRMNFIPEAAVVSLIESAGARMLHVQHDTTRDRTYYVTK